MSTVYFNYGCASRFAASVYSSVKSSLESVETKRGLNGNWKSVAAYSRGIGVLI